MKNFEKKLKQLKDISEVEAKQIVATNCKAFRLFVRRDGFKDSDTLHFDTLNKEQFSILTHREWHIPIKKRLKLMSDEPLPPYMETDKITFYPVKWRWNKKTLEIMYEER